MHNTRIERLWYDVTHGFGQKWKNFFADLEAHCQLNPSLPHHIWLLHHLFLASVNEDAQEWADAWNSHQLSIRRERRRSPRDIFFFSMIQDGPRGLSGAVDEDIGDPALYGIDWDTLGDGRMMTHFFENNPDELQEDNPFDATPAQFSHVPCEPPNSPLTIAQIQSLDNQLGEAVDVYSRSMSVRRLVWVEALSICNNLYSAV